MRSAEAAFPTTGERLTSVSTHLERRSRPKPGTYKPKEGEKDLSKERPHRMLNWPLIIGAILVTLTLILAYFGPSLAERDPLEMSTIHRVGDKYLTPPYPPGTPGYPLGSDGNGRDLLSRMLWGLRPTLTMVLIVATVRLLLGAMIGLAAGWSTGRVGRILESAITAALSIPVIIVALGGIAAVGVDLGIWAFIFGLSITGWVETARVVRDQTQMVRGQTYVEAARALGASNISILTRHVIQQILSLLWMLFAFEISATLMLTAALGFLGYYIGGDVWVVVTDATAAAVSGAPELGQMLATSGVSITKPWGLLVIGALVFSIVLGFNLLGEGLRKQLSLYGKSGSTRWSQFMANLRLWIDEHIGHPVSMLPRSPAFRPVFVLLVVGAVLAGGFYLGFDRFIVSDDDPQQDTNLQNEHLWSGADRDPFGTRWVQAAGPDSPEVIWTFTDDTGFSGGPAVARDGIVYLTSRSGLLYALTSEGKIIWQVLLPEIPVGTPALSQAGIIYVSDGSGGLSAIGVDGELQWRYADPSNRSAATGPVVTENGTIFYVVRGAILAFNPQGELLWEAHPTSPNTAPSEMLQLAPRADLLFWGDVVLDAATGSVLDPANLERPDRYFIGANERIYQIKGHDVIQWDGDGLEASVGTRLTWEYSKYTVARTPEDAGAAPDGKVWLFYTGFARGFGFGEDTRIVWLDEGGELLSNAFHPIRNSQVIGIDEDESVYVCGNLEQGYGDPQCAAFSPASEDARWTLMLEAVMSLPEAHSSPDACTSPALKVRCMQWGCPRSGARHNRLLMKPLVVNRVGRIRRHWNRQEAEASILNKAGEPIGPTQGSAKLIFEDARVSLAVQRWLMMERSISSPEVELYIPSIRKVSSTGK
jgi:peptide/nickel transport system permease protein